jgi:hypothetical protein
MRTQEEPKGLKRSQSNLASLQNTQTKKCYNHNKDTILNHNLKYCGQVQYICAQDEPKPFDALKYIASNPLNAPFPDIMNEQIAESKEHAAIATQDDREEQVAIATQLEEYQNILNTEENRNEDHEDWLTVALHNLLGNCIQISNFI